jgi:hypothetical protein
LIEPARQIDALRLAARRQEIAEQRERLIDEAVAPFELNGGIPTVEIKGNDVGLGHACSCAVGQTASPKQSADYDAA